MKMKKIDGAGSARPKFYYVDPPEENADFSSVQINIATFLISTSKYHCINHSIRSGVWIQFLTNHNGELASN